MGEAKRRREAGLPPRKAVACMLPLDGEYTLVLLADGSVRLDGLCPKCDQIHWIWEGDVFNVLSALAALGVSRDVLAAASAFVAAVCSGEERPPSGLLMPQ